MAKTDSNIGSLPKTTYLAGDSLLVAEQQGEAVAVEGSLFIGFARQAVEPQAERAETAERGAEAAQKSATASQKAAATSETNAKESETNAARSKTAAAYSEANAKASETAAKDSETIAAAAKEDAQASQKAAAESRSAAATSEKNAKAAAENAEASKNSAAVSAQRIEDMGVEASTIAHDKEATVTKESGADAVKLIFGIPGGKSAYQYAVDAGYTGTEKEFGELLRANAGVSYVADGGRPGSIDTLVFDGGTPFTVDELDLDGGAL